MSSRNGYLFVGIIGLALTLIGFIGWIETPYETSNILVCFGCGITLILVGFYSYKKSNDYHGKTDDGDNQLFEILVQKDKQIETLQKIIKVKDEHIQYVSHKLDKFLNKEIVL